jgi:hypothetical protein
MGPPAGPERHEAAPGTEGSVPDVEDTVAVDATPAEVAADADATDDGVAVGGEGAGIDPAAEADDAEVVHPARAAARPTPAAPGPAADG